MAKIHGLTFNPMWYFTIAPNLLYGKEKESKERKRGKRNKWNRGVLETKTERQTKRKTDREIRELGTEEQLTINEFP